jgi:PHD/YefM family antitoxin component YafN of YafNO toxin-antitoxin module
VILVADYPIFTEEIFREVLRHETEWVTISKDEYDSMNRTIEVLADRDVMAQIKKGKAKNAKSRDFEDVAKELGI